VLLRDFFYEILSNYESRFGKVAGFDYASLPAIDYTFDPLYGRISLTKPVQYLMSLPIVERLGRIRQLALSNYVYVGANHTRLEHSLGVAYLLTTIPADLNEMDKTILFIAGLLHDIGHSGWGHALDGLVAKVVTEASGISDTFPKFGIEKLDIAVTSYLLYGNDQLMHSLFTIARTISEQWNNLRLDKEPRLFRDIVAWVVSEEESGQKFFCDKSYWPRISESLVNRIQYFQKLLGRGINCDRLDYLERDGHHAFCCIEELRLPLKKISEYKRRLKVRQKGKTPKKERRIVEPHEFADLREKLYRDVYEGIARSFIDSLLTRLVYSTITILANTGNSISSPSAKGKVIMSYVFSPDEQLTYYTEKILQGASYPSVEAPRMSIQGMEFVKGSYVLYDYFFRNLRSILSIITEQFQAGTTPISAFLESKKVGYFNLDSQHFEVFYLSAPWLIAKVMNIRTLLAIFSKKPHGDIILWHIINEFFDDLRTDVLTALDVEQIEHKINDHIRNNYVNETKVHLLPNYYFLRRLTDELADFSSKSKLAERDIFSDFENLLIEGYKNVPLFFIVVNGVPSSEILAEVEDLLAGHVSRDVFGAWIAAHGTQ
jgi:HD superfamily phosphohydrolase